jgi:hypothetical protein
MNRARKNGIMNSEHYLIPPTPTHPPKKGKAMKSLTLEHAPQTLEVD